MNTVKVSVITYVLNSVPYIETCIRSIMDQTLPEIEILIIDGGSTDGTLEILERLAEMDARIQIVHSAPGVGKQFNTGLHMARGKYVGICEADDYILPGMYEYQYEIAERCQLDVLRADAIHFLGTGEEGELLLPIELTKQKDLYDKVLDTTEDMRVLRLGINSFWSGLYRRDFLLEQQVLMNETKGAAYQDISFYFLALAQARRVMLSKKAFYCYRLDNPASSVNSPQRLAMLIDEYCLLKRRLISLGLFEKYKEIYLSWKIRGHLGFYNSLSGELRGPYADLMYQDIYDELATEAFSGTELSLQESEVADLVRQAPEALPKYLDEKYRWLGNMQMVLEALDRDRPAVIFGNGLLGKLVYSCLQTMGCKVAAYADNDGTRWKGHVNDISVMSPEKAACDYPQAVYIIANEKHSDEMKEQLLDLGIERQNIVVCNHYAFLLKYVLQIREKENRR